MFYLNYNKKARQMQLAGKGAKMLSNSKVDQKSFLVKALDLVGRYGLPAYLVILLIALVAACFQAWTVARVAIMTTLPILLGLALYIEVKEALND